MPAGVSLPAEAQEPATPERAQESFHVISGMYDKAEDSVVGLFVLDQYVDQLLTSLKSVPPTATLNGVEAVPLTAKPCWAAVSPLSHASEPLSPEATATVMP
jgi:poly-beta-hydroxyalkanoate depolymerase